MLCIALLFFFSTGKEAPQGKKKHKKQITTRCFHKVDIKLAKNISQFPKERCPGGCCSFFNLHIFLLLFSSSLRCLRCTSVNCTFVSRPRNACMHGVHVRSAGVRGVHKHDRARRRGGRPLLSLWRRDKTPPRHLSANRRPLPEGHQGRASVS